MIEEFEMMVSTQHGKSRGALTATRLVRSQEDWKQSAWAWWGENDRFPLEVMEDLRQDTVVGPRLEFRAKQIYGGGPVLGNLVSNDKGIEEFRVVQYKPWTKFLRQSGFEKYCEQAALELVTYGNIFPEIYLSNPIHAVNSKILKFEFHKSAKCRLEKMNSEGEVKNIYYSADFGTNTKIPNERLTVVPKLDDFFDVPATLRSAFINTGSRKFGIHQTIAGFGLQNYYAEVVWNNVRVSGWMEYAKKILAYKISILENQVTIKYMLYIDEKFWPSVYGKEAWAELDVKPKEKNALKKRWLDKFNEFLNGVDNSGKSVIFPSYFNQITQETLPFIQIVPVPQPEMTKQMIENSEEVSTHLISGLAFDPAMGPMRPGKGFGAGSGSDKRVAWELSKHQLKSGQDTILQPAGWWRDYNRHDYKLVPRMRNTIVVPLNDGEGVKQDT